MALFRFCLSVGVILSLVQHVPAVTTRTANVVVVNYTGRIIYSVSLVHKYSDLFRSRGNSIILFDGMRSLPHQVRYNTGFLTTGRDLWVVTWYQVTSRFAVNQFYSDPDNFRYVIDALESVAPEITSVAFELAAATATAEAGPQAQVLAARAAGKLANVTSQILLNTESTVGFKQHILRKEDENKIVQIELHRHGKIVIRSPSGVSETRYSSRNAYEAAP